VIILLLGFDLVILCHLTDLPVFVNDITRVLCQLHRLKAAKQLKLSIRTHKCLNGLAPLYLAIEFHRPAVCVILCHTLLDDIILHISVHKVTIVIVIVYETTHTAITACNCQPSVTERFVSPLLEQSAAACHLCPFTIDL